MQVSKRWVSSVNIVVVNAKIVIWMIEFAVCISYVWVCLYFPLWKFYFLSLVKYELHVQYHANKFRLFL